MDNISLFIILLFLLIAIITIWIFFRAGHYSKRVMISVAAYAIIQSTLGVSGFYTNWSTVPPHLLLLVGPPIFSIILLLLLPVGRKFLDVLNIETLTILHIIRIPVEITLYYLFIGRLIPQSMTFEGSNFDILSGISAPIMYYLVFIARKANQKVLIAWNFICLALLLNVVITALLSAKTPFQKFAFDQPNIGIGYFPFVLLPAVVVPIVLLSHLASLRQLLKNAPSPKRFVITAGS
jgi:hypothetical protein